ncbi:hypothetical protein CYMTET_26602 [Cymbomonas tetramitiformis]|uniref:Uncharacterized protein n=1 Tax=Cymbomonas tetramitiformis TaxID=36881 RepID=A0AAE0KY33_9CHLO|nr:hypothetical protein CYMTET_26602 [Cymbomonas tetramitiformis]
MTRGALRRAMYALSFLGCFLQVYNLFVRKRREAESRSEEARLLAAAICINDDGTVREWTSTDLVDCGKIRSVITNENAWLELFEETLNEYARSQAACIGAAVRQIAEGTRPYVTLISLVVVIVSLSFALLIRITADVAVTREKSVMATTSSSPVAATGLVDSFAILPYHYDRRRRPYRRAARSPHHHQRLVITDT